MKRSWGHGTDQRLRSENQDTHGVFEFPEFTLCVVCDGMGGHAGGAQASSLAVKTIHDQMEEMQGKSLSLSLPKAIEAANKAIFDAARKNHRLTGMGTTVVAIAVDDSGTLFLAHVGDSRAYLVRGGEIAQLTRDHTMVNLFVDAELLTPEDAATHPEAHVLSRSLGVERQVDVEVAEPFALEDDDALILCSDGVHGVLTDFEIAAADFTKPHAAIASLLGMVGDREGDDNATAVALSMLDSSEKVAPTPVPEAKPLSTPAPVRRTTIPPLGTIPAPQTKPEPELPPATPAPPTPTPAQRKEREFTEEDARALYQLDDEPTHATPEPQVIEVAPPAAEAPPSKPRVSRRKMEAWGVGATIGAVLALGIIAILVVNKPADASTDGANDDGSAQLIITGSDGTVVSGTGDDDDAPLGPDLSRFFFAPDLPEPPKRLPHRARLFTSPPPGGSIQFEAIQAARRHECGSALTWVQKGMRASPEHATLYSQAWYCFNETHQRPLAAARLESAAGFGALIKHFEGEPPDDKKKAKGKLPGTGKDAKGKGAKGKAKAEEPDPNDPEAAKKAELPYWFKGAYGGIEFRLEKWLEAEDDRFSEVMDDLVGEATVADHLGRDLMIIVQAARALSKLPAEQRTEKTDGWWARRVYVTTKALEGNAGELLDTHRPDLVPQIRRLLHDSITGEAIPEVVTEAHGVALGTILPPDEKPVEVAVPKPRPKPKPEPEPEPEGPQNPVVHGAEKDPLSKGRGAPEDEQ